MRKSLFLVPALVVVGGGAYALVANLFPDTVPFPRVPMEQGSIGYTIARVLGVTNLITYTGDGTVKNSDALGGIAGTGYLQNMDCGAGYVWTRIDSTGRAVCELKSGDLLAQLGNIRDVNGVTEIQRVGSTDFITANVGDEIIEGDIVRTAPGARTSIAFVDGSVLRLDIDTTVELSVGKNSTNQAIAQVILNNGSLWGRVLTSTGINIGTKEFIAGVRGTSVALKTNPSFTTFSIVQSQNFPAAEITVTGSQTKTPMGTGASLTTYAGNAWNPSAIITPGVTSLYSQSWIRDNVLKDIDYMNTLTTTEDPLLRDKVTRELAITLPTGTDESDALCSDDGSQTKLVFWSSLVGTSNTKCQDDSLVAFADYTKQDKGIYGKSLASRPEIDSASLNPASAEGMSITLTGQYISYPLSSLTETLGGQSLVGKTLTFELGTPIGQGTATKSKMYLANFGSENFFIQKDSSDCIPLSSPGRYSLCQKTGTNAAVSKGDITGQTVLTVSPTITPSQFFVGNVSTTTTTFPLSNSIKKISIK